MNGKVFGGTTNYGQVAGILMFDSQMPRIPGDPGHAETFPFPVRYGVIRDFPFQDLVDRRRDHLDLVIRAAQDLEREGVNFVAADCGLFSLSEGWKTRRSSVGWFLNGTGNWMWIGCVRIP